MDAGANAMDAGAAGDKSTEDPAVTAKKTEEKAAAAGAKKAPVIKAEMYSPILDAEVELVGISNKVHKKTTNLIQVLYCKAAANAMM